MKTTKMKTTNGITVWELTFYKNEGILTIKPLRKIFENNWTEKYLADIISDDSVVVYNDCLYFGGKAGLKKLAQEFKDKWVEEARTHLNKLLEIKI